MSAKYALNRTSSVTNSRDMSGIINHTIDPLATQRAGTMRNTNCWLFLFGIEWLLDRRENPGADRRASLPDRRYEPEETPP